MKEKVKILVVDDNPLNQTLVGFMLGEWGYAHDSCFNGKEAIEHLRAASYDLILLDIQMPEMDGYETAEYIRTVLKLEVPIIAMTAQVFEDEKQRCLRSGMTNYIPKPIQEADLHQMIIDCLSLEEA